MSTVRVMKIWRISSKSQKNVGMIRLQMILVNCMRSQMIVESFKAADDFPFDLLQILKTARPRQ